MANNKVCKQCGSKLPSTPEYFRRDKYEKDGLVRRCKRCERKPRDTDGLLPGQKLCRGCHTVYPANAEHFGVYNLSKDGLKSRCRACLKKDGQEYRVKLAEKVPVTLNEKRCSKCRQVLPATHDYFYKSNTISGLDGWCKQCKREDLSRRELIPERIEYVHMYRSRPEVMHRNNARNRKRYNHPEVKEQAFARTRNRRARKNTVQGTHTPQQIQDQLRRQKHRCYYAACGHAKFKKVRGKYSYHIDHTYPVSRVAGTDIPANDISYLVLTCEYCNKSKGNKYPWEWSKGGRLL